MNEPLNENDMKAEFRQLRETEMRVAPGYRQTASGPAVAAPRRRIRPAIQFALDEDCRTQCRVSFESRTNAYQVRTGEFTEDQISVYLTVRRYESLGPDETYAGEFDRLSGLCRDLVDEYLVSNVLRPLQEAISLQ